MKGFRYCGYVLSMLAVVALIIGACGGSVSKGDVPKWYLNPPKDDDKIYGSLDVILKDVKVFNILP